MSLVKDSSTRSLIYTTALHANQTVLYNIQKSAAVLTAYLVQNLDYLLCIHLLAVYTGRNTFLEVDGYISSFIRCILRRYA